MKLELKKISIPSWISFRSYCVDEKNSRTYISNEKNHIFIQLDGLASDLYYHLSKNIEESFFVEWLQKNNLQNEFESFLDELLANELISYEDYSNVEVVDNEYDLPQENSDDDFVTDRNSWLRENNFLGTLFLELTYKCNLKCVHCYNPKDTNHIEIPIDKIKEIIDDAYNLGCYGVVLSGGEPSLHTDFIKIAQYIRDKHLSLEIFTNGQVLASNDTIFAELINLYPHKICLSLYSTAQKTHEKITCVEGSFEKTTKAVKLLKDKGVNIQIKDFLLNINCSDCISTMNYANIINASSVFDLSLIPTMTGDKHNYQYLLSDEELFALYTDSKSPLFIDVDEIDNAKKIGKKEPLCFGGFDSLCVSPDLSVRICVSMPLTLGNLANERLAKIWNDAIQGLDSPLYRWRKTTIGDLKECYSYDYCRFCNYCAGMACLENGYLEKSFVLCKQAQIKKKAYDYLKENKF